MEIINSYKQTIPKVKFIGKKYGDVDRVDGGFGFAWKQWITNNWFEPIEKAAGGREACQAIYEDGNACLGYMRYKEGEPFEYWIGMFTPVDTEVPEGYESVDVEQSNCGICWYYGQEPDIYGKEDQAMNKLRELGMTIKSDNQDAFWFFERYSPNRFDKADEKGCVVLDIGFYVD